MARLENQPAAVPARPGQTLTRLFSISYLAIDYPRTSIVLWALISIAGVFAFLNLKLGLFPDIAFPVVIVTAQTGQNDVSLNERDATDRIERALHGLSGVDRSHSLTYPQFVEIDLSFDVSEGLAARKQEVEDALRDARLPAAIKTTVSTEDLNESPVVTYALAGSASPAAIAALAKAQIEPKLEAIPGVRTAKVVGGVTTGDNASVFRVDGKPAVAISVTKTANANTLDVGEACDEAMAAIAKTLPAVAVSQASTQVTYILEASRATQEALLLAVLLAILVILPFLRDWRATAISAIAIPVSLLGTAIVMWMFHFKLETITLLALALVVGVILDDAIVAVENIVRHLENGETAKGAALEANKEIGLTLVAASLTIVAVFLPIGLMRGTLGQFFRPFGLTASAAVIFSLLAARTLSPTIAAWWLPKRTKGPRTIDVEHFLAHPRYRHVLTWSLVHRKSVMALAFAAFAAGLALIPFIPKGFIPHLDRGEFLVTFSTPLGTSMAEVETSAAALESSILKDPAVSAVYTSIGAQAGQPNVGTIDVRLKAKRKVTTTDVLNAVRGRLPALDGVVTDVEDVPFVGSSSAKPLQVALIGSNLDLLRATGQSFENLLAKQKGFVNVAATGLSDGTPFSPIEHVNGKRAMQITADLTGNVQLGDADATVRRQAKLVLPKDNSIVLAFGGASQDASTTFRDFGIALGFSIVAIVVVLLVLFRSWVDPIVIVSALPLSIVGALFALWITRADFGIISMMAVIFLFGLVNKNAILLVDRIKKLRSLGMARSDAIGEAGAQRLRPILMTTAATILGMLPIALGFGAGAELRAPMAVAIIGGLITSTVLSLVVVPVVYTIFDDWARGGELTP